MWEESALAAGPSYGCEIRSSSKLGGPRGSYEVAAILNRKNACVDDNSKGQTSRAISHYHNSLLSACKKKNVHNRFCHLENNQAASDICFEKQLID